MLGERTITVAGVDLTLGAFRDCLDRLPRRRPYFIRASPSYAARLATSSSRMVGRSPGIPARGHDRCRDLSSVQEVAIRTGFGCRVVNHYSTWEVPHVAQSCPDDPALLHVNSERRRPPRGGGDGRDVRAGERGRVVVTALTNDVMPFVNYDLGDWAIRGPVCPCGRGFPTLAAIDGRSGRRSRPRRARDHARDAGHPACLADATSSASSPTTRPEQTAPDTVVFGWCRCPASDPRWSRCSGRPSRRLIGSGVAVSVETVDRVLGAPSGKRLIIRSRGSDRASS